MSGLVGYDSSDEEVDAANEENQLESKTQIQAENTASTSANSFKPTANGSTVAAIAPAATSSHLAPNTDRLGPPEGPSQPTDLQSTTLSAPSSPYTTTRSQIRNLTLPPNPNLTIPPSPPGSPTPSTDTKIIHFLNLKKSGIHFNAKLASSSALKNPSLLSRLMDAAGVESGAQYATALPNELWDPNGWPEWAFKEELAKAQVEVRKRKEEERAKGSRGSVEFVTATGSEASSRAGTPGLRGGKGRAAERFMGGLDRERKSSPHVGAGGMGTGVDRRGGKIEDSLAGDGSRSPKRRKRSRSK